MELTAEEARVLGCLVEKQLTTPQQYPLTDNALLAACNQATSRDPVVAYDTGAVRMAVRSLRERGLLRTVHRTGERSDKHLHVLDDALGLSTGQQVLLALLLLRGPQTAAELRARSERMHPFASTPEAEDELDALAARDEPLVTRLARQPGQKEGRFQQLLVDTGAAAPRGPERPADSWVEDAEPSRARESGREDEVETLRQEVTELRREVAALREAVVAAGTPSSASRTATAAVSVVPGSSERLPYS